MSDCKHCKKDTGGFEYCNEFCEIQGLRKQLAEAREEIDIQKGHLELAISLSDDPNIKLLCTALLEQLKERGNE